MSATGSMLREARRAARLTQAQLAQRTGLARTAISMYERGAREAGADAFLRLLTASGAPVVATQVAAGVDCWRNSEVFVSLTSVLDAGVPLAPAGELAYPAHLWRR